MDQSNANLEKEISQVRNDIATNIDDVKAIWKETEKKYSADKQVYQDRIDMLNKSQQRNEGRILKLNESFVDVEDTKLKVIQLEKEFEYFLSAEVEEFHDVARKVQELENLHNQYEETKESPGMVIERYISAKNKKVESLMLSYESKLNKIQLKLKQLEDPDTELQRLQNIHDKHLDVLSQQQQKFVENMQNCIVEDLRKSYLKEYPNSTPFVIACELGDLDHVKLFVENQNAIDKTTIKSMVNKLGINTSGCEYTALMVASLEGHFDVVKYLCELKLDGKDAVNIHKAGSNGWTSLMYAAFNEHVDIVKYLLSKGAEIDHADHNGENVLHFVAIHSSRGLDTIKLLLTHSDLKTMNRRTSDEYKNTPLDWAEHNESSIKSSIVELMSQFGCKHSTVEKAIEENSKKREKLKTVEENSADAARIKELMKPYIPAELLADPGSFPPAPTLPDDVAIEVMM